MPVEGFNPRAKNNLILFFRLQKSSENKQSTGHFTKQKIEEKTALHNLMHSFPLLIQLCNQHNHKIVAADHLKYKQVSIDTRKYFEEKFFAGKFPAEAVRDRRWDIRQVSLMP